ncbi:MAG TPA: phosphatase PAP2 family protein [Patescibacteria group bacterium]|nr:phosphatase PAP2 family protein [Patescibacteria group bacterium]
MPLDALAASYRSYPLRWTVALLLPFLVFPQIDLAVSGWFYQPGAGFYLKALPFFRFILKDMPVIVIGAAVAVLVLGVAGAALGRVFCGVTRQVAAFIVLSLALGPGVVVNLLLKDHWGRARPSQIAEFGGSAHFTPPLMMADQCTSNCSFSSGHGALGFWVIAFALLAPPRWRPLAVAAALAFGVMVGVVRIAQGGHFLSDVVVSALVVVSLTLWLKQVLLKD